MKKRLTNILKNQQGFTLLELIAVVAILGILSLSVAMLINPSLNIFYRSTNLSRSSVIISNIMDMAEKEISYATKIETVTKWPSGEPDVEGVQSFSYTSPVYGSMYFDQINGMPLIRTDRIDTPDENQDIISLDSDFYMNNTVKIGITGTGNTICITAAVYDRLNRPIGLQKRYVRLLNTTYDTAT